METPPYPCFLDVEASGFGDKSYPIEIAWSNEAGEIQRYLINPASCADWVSWNADSEKIHGIDRPRLERNGWDPEFVATRLTEDLHGKTVYTDAPDFDDSWVAKLFTAVKQPKPFHCEHIDELLLTVLRKPDDAIWQAMLHIERIKNELTEFRSGTHSAGYDVGYLLQLWRKAHGDAVKMNHGIGPLPLTTATGTFMRLKSNK